MSGNDPCICGHRRERHLDGAGRCFEPEGVLCWCSLSCQKFTLNVQEVERRKDRRAEIGRQMAKIDRARDHLDANWKGEGKWKPSELIRNGYFVLATSQHPELAAPFVDDLLSEARARYRDGYFATPFGEPVMRNLSA